MDNLLISVMWHINDLVCMGLVRAHQYRLCYLRAPLPPKHEQTPEIRLATEISKIFSRSLAICAKWKDHTDSKYANNQSIRFVNILLMLS